MGHQQCPSWLKAFQSSGVCLKKDFLAVSWVDQVIPIFWLWSCRVSLPGGVKQYHWNGCKAMFDLVPHHQPRLPSLLCQVGPAQLSEHSCETRWVVVNCHFWKFFALMFENCRHKLTWQWGSLLLHERACMWCTLGPKNTYFIVPWTEHTHWDK